LLPSIMTKTSISTWLRSTLIGRTRQFPTVLLVSDFLPGDLILWGDYQYDARHYEIGFVLTSKFCGIPTLENSESLLLDQRSERYYYYLLLNDSIVWSNVDVRDLVVSTT